MGATNISAAHAGVGPAANWARAEDVYRFMLRMRRVEETAGQLYALGVIKNEIKLSIGREALIVGLMNARTGRDPVVFGERCHGALLAFGVQVEDLFAALADSGLSDFDPKTSNATTRSLRPEHFYSCRSGCHASMMWAVSLALLGRRHDTTDVIFVVVDGDTVTRQAMQRPLNFAVRHKLPIVTLIDHATPSHAEDLPQHLKQIHSRVAFDVVDGIGDLSVSTACARAAERAREGHGPQGLSISTQAFRGHASNSVSAGKTTTGHRQQLTDPVLRARSRVVGTGADGEEQATLIETEVRAEVRQAGLAARAQSAAERGEQTR